MCVCVEPSRDVVRVVVCGLAGAGVGVGDQFSHLFKGHSTRHVEVFTNPLITTM